MNVTSSAVSLNVSDERTSAAFLVRHFGFTEEMAATGSSRCRDPTSGMNVIYLRTGLPTFKPEHLRGRHADGLLLVFVVDDVDAEYVRLEAEGVEFTTPIETEPWGERYFQVSDPNGIVIQLVTWVGTPPQGLGKGDS